jgi:subtilisin family serine protease
VLIILRRRVVSNVGKTGRLGVINLSLGSSYSRSVNNAVNGAVNANIVSAVAAGNDNSNACNYSPASAVSAITVGATDIMDNRAYYSNYGTCLDIFAPGSSITSAWIDSPSDTNTISGTSMASPHVAGVASQLRSSTSLYNAYDAVEIGDLIVELSTKGAVQNANGGTSSDPDNVSPNALLFTSCNYTGPASSASSVAPCTLQFVVSIILITITISGFLM